MSYAAVRSGLKQLRDAWFATKIRTLRALGIVDFPVPPNHSMRGTSSATIRHYYESGLTTLIPITVAAMCNGVSLNQGETVLDFGCGVGRQLLHLTRLYPGIEIAACDVNDDSIAFVRAAYPAVDSYPNSFDPPLKFKTNTFDVIYSVSIFSHLSKADRDAWLVELFRVLKPGGLCLLTINGLTSLRRAHTAGRRRHLTEPDLANTGFAFDCDQDLFWKEKNREKQSRFGSLVRGIDRPYGETYHSAAGFKDAATTAGFELVQLLEGVIDTLQDLVVLRKPQ